MSDDWPEDWSFLDGMSPDDPDVRRLLDMYTKPLSWLDPPEVIGQHPGVPRLDTEDRR